MEGFLGFILNNFPDIAYTTNYQGKIIRINQYLYDLFKRNGITPDIDVVMDILNLRKEKLGDAVNYGQLDYGFNKIKFSDEEKLIYCNIPTQLPNKALGLISLNLTIPREAKKLDDIIKYLNNQENLYNTPIEIILTDATGEIKYVNKKGLINARGEKTEQFLDIATGSCIKEYRNIIKRSLKEKRLIQERIFITQGHKKMVEIITFPLISEVGLIGTVSFGINVVNILKVKDKVKQISKVNNIGQITCRLIAALRSPLQEIKATAEVAGLKVDDQQIEGYFESINNNINKVNNLLTDIVQLSNISGFELEETNTNCIVDSIYKNIRRDCKRLNINLKIVNKNLKVIVDKVLFVQAILNIIENACDVLKEHDQERIIKIEVYEKRGYIYFSIYNSGPKIPEKIKSSIFDIFTSTKGLNGTGLGLAISYYIITHIHQGDLCFNSTSEGTTFYIKIKAFDIKQLM